MAANLVEQDVKDAGAAPSSPTAVAGPKTKAFFFNSAAQPLFGLYGPPQSQQDRDHGVLLCAPAGNEYLRTHWCLRLLGDHLIQTGFHVMRFDYSCLGDSWGTFEQATVEQWVADVKTAHAELQDNAGVRQISVIGLRLGGALACAAAREIPLHHLVLWDPVLDGLVYVNELRAMQRKLLRTWPHAPVWPPGAEHEELLGYRYPRSLLEQVSLLNLAQGALPQAERVSLVLSADDPAGRQFQQRLEQQHIWGELRVVTDNAAWDTVEDDLYAEPLLLPSMRRAIADLLGEST
jgi:pimeloyl-ACP methyl ester carboxylesterase